MHRKTKHWLFFGIALVVLAAAAGMAGVHYYPQLIERRLLRNARVMLVQKNDKSAWLAAVRVLQKNDRSVGAIRILAEISERGKYPTALTWKRRLVEVEPKSLENRLSLAETALDLNRTDIAEESLAVVRESGKGSARLHALAGRVARAGKDALTAEMEFSKALELEPSNKLFQCDLQSQRIDSQDPAVAAEARASLERMLDQPELFVKASRLLINDSIRRRDDRRTFELADALQKSPGAAFIDRLAYLDMLRHLNSAHYAKFLTQLQEASVNNPQDLYAMISYLNDTGSSLMVVDWSKRLPDGALSEMPVPIALSKSYASLQDWKSLKPLVIGSAVEARGWKPVSQDFVDWGEFRFLRLAFLSRVLRAEGDAVKSTTQWENAVKEAGNRSDAVAVLARYAVDWGWEAQSTDLLWRVARGPLESSEQLWALKLLNRRCEKARAARDMLNVAARFYEIDPSDRGNANNLALLDLLLGADAARGARIAKELYDADPTNPIFVSTYAFASFSKGRSQEAVKLMKTLPEDRLDSPSVAAYYGMMLAAVGSAEEARKFLQLGDSASLLPEERKLVDRAWKKIQLAIPNPAPSSEAKAVK